MAGIADLKGTYVLDPSHSQVGFIARHAMVTKVRGTFNEVDGTATFDGSNPSSSSLTVAIDPMSVRTDYPWPEVVDFEKVEGGPGVFAGDLYYYFDDGDLRNGLVAGIDTDVCPLYLLSGEYD